VMVVPNEWPRYQTGERRYPFIVCWLLADSQKTREKDPCLLYLICVILLPLPVQNMYRH